MVPTVRLTAAVAPEDALALLIDFDCHAETFADAFDARLSRDDLNGAHVVLKRMEASDEERADICRESMDRTLAAHRSELRRRLLELAEQTGQASSSGYFAEDRRAEITASINNLTSRMNTDEGVLAAIEGADFIAEEIDPALNKAVRRIGKQIDRLLPDDAGSERALVSEALDARDLAVLHEQLDCLKRNQPLVDSRDDACERLRAFRKIADNLESELDSETGFTHHKLTSAARDRDDVASLLFFQPNSSAGKEIVPTTRDLVPDCSKKVPRSGTNYPVLWVSWLFADTRFRRTFGRRCCDSNGKTSARAGALSHPLVRLKRGGPL